MAKLTAANRKRLDKLATYLEGLPEDYAHFDMGLYTQNFGDGAAMYARKNGGIEKYGCGTAACAAGHGPAAGILVPRDMVRRGIVHWDEYCVLFTGDLGVRWHWCFGGDWDEHDNHHYGAAARIRYLLERDEPPTGFWRPASCWIRAYAPYRIDAAKRSLETA